MIGDDFVIETKSFEYFGEEQGGDSSSVNGFFVGQRITPLVSPWSTTTRRVSKPSERGRSVIRLQEIC